MTQAHRASASLISHNLCDHQVVAGAINYHLFRLSMLLSSHRYIQDEDVSLMRLVNEQQREK